MKRYTKTLRVLFLAMIAMLCFCGTAAAEEPSRVIIAYDNTGVGPGGGWKTSDTGATQYQKNGDIIRNSWEKIGGKWYRFDGNGNMLVGWQNIEGKYYYLTAEADMAHPLGSCYISERTPDGYDVDANGARIGEDAPVNGIVRANPYGAQTCIEIVLSEQQVYVYQGMQLVMIGPCVTGSVAGGHATPAGDYKIYSMERDRTLRGTNNDGSKYASFVHFWMPFNGGIGLHDASWRNTFGGQIYVSGGSHGCVNMPYANAEFIYNMAYVGMPVHVHN